MKILMVLFFSEMERRVVGNVLIRNGSQTDNLFNGDYFNIVMGFTVSGIDIMQYIHASIIYFPCISRN